MKRQKIHQLYHAPLQSWNRTQVKIPITHDHKQFYCSCDDSSSLSLEAHKGFRSRLISWPGLNLVQYTYKGPNQPIPGNPQLIRVEVLVRDSPEAGGVQIQNVSFNGENISLKPRDIYGNRGVASFQVPPGKYKLIWVVQRDKLLWPRSITHEELVNIDSRDLWIQISIEGNEVFIR